MADATVGVTDLATGTGVKKVDTTELTVAGGLVERQRIVIADNTGAALFATVTAGGALKVDNSAVTQPVSGTFFQATQPVSIAASVPVTGTFFQATQPVSGTVTVGNASLAVTGTFFQATQPVSGTVTANAGTNLNTSALATSANLTAGTQQTQITDGTRVGTVKAASTAAVATDTALVVALSPNNAIATTTTALAATSSPSYSNGTNNSLSANLAGALRVDGSAVTQPVSGAVTANLGTGIPDTASTGNTLNSATLNLAYTLTIANGQSTVSFSVTGLTASAATLTIEASDDGGVTWATVNGIAPGSGVLFTTLTTDQQFRVGAAARNRIRLRVSTIGAGTITIASTISAGVGLVALSTSLPVGSNIIGALSANQSINNAQINGVTPLMGNGVTGTGSQRVTIASDNTAFSVNAVQSGTWNVGTVTTLPALPANQSTNIAQMNGVTTSMNAGAADTGTQRVVLSNEATQDLNITGQATQTAVSQNIILAVAGTGSTDCTGYRAISIQIIPTGTVTSGVVTFEGSNDNTTFTAISLQDEAAPTADPVSTVSPTTGVNRYMTGPVRWRYFRARISTLIGGGGSIAAVTRLTQVSFSDDQISVTQTTASLLNTTIGAALPVGTNVVGGVSLATITTGGGGVTVFPQLLAAASTNATSVKVTAGKIYGGSICNTSATKYYFKIYDKSSAPTVGTDTPIATIFLPVTTTLYVADLVSAYGLRCSAGIAFAITGASPVADTTAVTTLGDVIVNLLYA